MTMLSVVSVHAAATVGALSWFKSESSFPIFWLVPAFKKQFQISRFFPKKVILPQQPQLPTTLERLWPNMVPTAPFPQLRGDVSWHQVQQLKNKQEDTLKTNEERQEAHSPGRSFAMCSTIRCSMDWCITESRCAICLALDHFWGKQSIYFLARAVAPRKDVPGCSSMATPFESAAVSVRLPFGSWPPSPTWPQA